MAEQIFIFPCGQVGKRKFHMYPTNYEVYSWRTGVVLLLLLKDDRHEVKSLKLSSAFVATNAAPRTDTNLERITLNPIDPESSSIVSP